jgi:hypothetical protein
MHGCEPDRWLTDHEFIELGQAIEQVGGGRGGQMVMTTSEGVVEIERQFSDLDGSMVDPAVADAEAERTRQLRALYGGNVVAASSNLPPGTFNIDDPADMERLRVLQEERQRERVHRLMREFER